MVFHTGELMNGLSSMFDPFCVVRCRSCLLVVLARVAIRTPVFYSKWCKSGLCVYSYTSCSLCRSPAVMRCFSSVTEGSTCRGRDSLQIKRYDVLESKSARRKKEKRLSWRGGAARPICTHDVFITSSERGHMRLYKNPGMNPLSPNWVIVFFTPYGFTGYQGLSLMTSMRHRPGSWWLARSYNPSAIYNCDSKRSTGLKNR